MSFLSFRRANTAPAAPQHAVPKDLGEQLRQHEIVPTLLRSADGQLLKAAALTTDGQTVEAPADSAPTGHVSNDVVRRAADLYTRGEAFYGAAKDPVTRRYLKEPVTLPNAAAPTSTGRDGTLPSAQTYSKPVISRWLQDGHTTTPITHEPLDLTTAIPNDRAAKISVYGQWVSGEYPTAEAQLDAQVGPALKRAPFSLRQGIAVGAAAAIAGGVVGLSALGWHIRAHKALPELEDDGCPTFNTCAATNSVQSHDIAQTFMNTATGAMEAFNETVRSWAPPQTTYEQCIAPITECVNNAIADFTNKLMQATAANHKNDKVFTLLLVGAGAAATATAVAVGLKLWHDNGRSRRARQVERETARPALEAARTAALQDVTTDLAALAQAKAPARTTEVFEII